MRRLVLFAMLAACGGSDHADASTTPASTGTTAPTTGELPTTGGPDATTGEPACDAACAAIQRYCEFLFTCGCTPLAWPDPETCIASLIYAKDGQQQLAGMDGLTFDPACYALGFDYQVDVVGCKTGDEIAALPPPSMCPRCLLAHGDLPADAACTPSTLFAFGSACGPGLECVDGTCRDRCQLRTVDEPCATTQGDDLPCAADLFCDPSGGTCTPLPGPGEPCPANQCAPGLHCVGTCEPLPTAGEPCSGACAPGLFCDPVDGCQPPSAEGEACIPDGCAPGLHCAQGTCAPQLPAGGDCSADGEPACASNTECVRGTCAAQPPALCDTN